MEIGLSLLNHALPEKPHEQLLEEVIEQTRAARKAGFGLISTGQHYLASEYSYLQLIPLLSRLTAESGPMKVATGIVLLPLHHPVEIAEQLTTLNTMADSAVAGVGAGYRDVEFESFDVPKSERAPRLAEGVELIQRLWDEENVTYDGEFYSVEGVSINPRPQSPPPIWIAANSPRATERAARLGDAWYVNPHSTISEVIELKQNHYDPIREENGEDTSVPVIREAVVAPTTDEALTTAREYLAPRYEQYVDWGQNEAMEDESELGQAFNDLAEDRFVIGTPAEVCAEIERYEEELDASEVIIRLQWPGRSSEQTLESIELVGDEVIPNV